MDEDDTEDDSEDVMFHSFSSCSPRYIKFEEMKEVSRMSRCNHSLLDLYLYFIILFWHTYKKNNIILERIYYKAFAVVPYILRNLCVALKVLKRCLSKYS